MTEFSSQRKIFIGYDPREIRAYRVAVSSITRHLTQEIPIDRLELPKLVQEGLYTRPTCWNDEGQLFDEISEHTMSTEFAISRFLTPIIAKEGWAAFLDCDILARCDLKELFDQADPKYAVMCVKHQHNPTGAFKMNGQQQSSYPRKNWSSVVLYNCDHQANKYILPRLVNKISGKFLHAFCWLEDDEIGSLDPAFNYLVDFSPPTITPKILHYTYGTPDMRGHEHCSFADEWRRELL